MKRRRARLVPKVVFRVAATATAIPVLALGGLSACRETPSVATRPYGSTTAVSPPPPTASSAVAAAITDASLDAADAGDADAMLDGRARIDAATPQRLKPIDTDRTRYPIVAYRGFDKSGTDKGMGVP